MEIAGGQPPRDGPAGSPGSGYLLERELGRGGMATVYLAHDRKHDRRVAVKVLHAELAAVLGAERFLQEIRVTAHLQHPHILGLIDSGVFGAEAGAGGPLADELAGRPYYVMPFVDGESLRQRLEREGQLPVADALRIAREVAAALEHAHRRGIVHRDVKPENVLLGEDGQALVADFGIALAVQQAGGLRLTQTGLSLGTPAYMSPEQAMGERQISPRSDVYALGAVLYEMLAGEPPFTGPTAQAIVARVLTEAPRPLASQRPSVRPHVDAAVRTALEKLPADRFASAAEFARALEGGSAELDGATHARARAGRALTRRTWVLGALACAVAGGALVAAVGAATGWRRATQEAAPVAAIRTTLLPPPGESFAGGAGLAVSADGTQLAFTVLRAAPRPRLLVRTLASGAVRELPGTADAEAPFWSPDGRMLGFFAGGELRVVPVAGGPVSVVAKAPAARGAAWAPDGTIIFASDPGGLVYRVPSQGGVPVAVTRRGTEGAHERPSLLPDGRRFLFAGEIRTGVFLADLRTGEQRRLRADGGAATYGAPGHLLFDAQGTLQFGRIMAQRFDPERGVVVGEAVPVADSVSSPRGAVSYAVSANGLLLFQEQPQDAARVWLDRQGVVRDSIPRDQAWSYRLSHDGTRVAQAGFGLWVRDMRRGVALQVSPGYDRSRQVMLNPVWSPDDTRLAFVAPDRTKASREIRVVQSDGTGGEVRLPAPGGWGLPLDWSPDGTTLLMTGAENDLAAAQSLWLLKIATRELTPWLAPGGSVPIARFSPDGRWVAYQSDETGAPEVYLRPYPGPGAPVRISPAGGGQPEWRADGGELFYLTPTGDLVAVPVRLSPASRIPDVGAPRVIIPETSRDPFSSVATTYDVSPDGQRFLVNAYTDVPSAPLTILAPWPLVLPRDAR